jgi:hypothetical protein
MQNDLDSKQSAMAIDPLSDLAHRLMKINAEHAYESLVPKTPDGSEAKSLLDATEAASLLAKPPANPDDADLLLSALYLWHDYLNASHKISQAISSSTGSFWHAIMHRREGDFSNSKYWYARCADHPVMAIISAQANPVLNPLPVDKSILKLTMNGWNPAAFVDLTKSVTDSPNDPRQKIAIALQKLEWRLLFDFTARKAIEGGDKEVFNP